MCCFNPRSFPNLLWSRARGIVKPAPASPTSEGTLWLLPEPSTELGTTQGPSSLPKASSIPTTVPLPQNHLSEGQLPLEQISLRTLHHSPFVLSPAPVWCCLRPSAGSRGLIPAGSASCGFSPPEPTSCCSGDPWPEDNTLLAERASPGAGGAPHAAAGPRNPRMDRSPRGTLQGDCPLGLSRSSGSCSCRACPWRWSSGGLWERCRSRG